jgi:hypothetical protein
MIPEMTALLAADVAAGMPMAQNRCRSSHTATALMRPRSVEEILRTSTARSGGLRARAELLATLSDRLRRLLPQPLATHLQLVALEQDRVAIWADSPVWRSRLHYQLPQIKRVLREQLGLNVTRVDTGVLPAGERLERPRRRAVLSAEAAANLQRAAGSIDDPQLSAALTRLAAHLPKSPSDDTREPVRPPSAGRGEDRK